jgi:hypothetical protein
MVFNSEFFLYKYRQSHFEQLIPLVDGHLRWWLPVELCTKFPVGCNHRFTFVNNSVAHKLLRLRCYFPQLQCKWHLVVKLVSSSSVISKRHYLAYRNTFILDSHAFQFMSNVTLKLPIFDVSLCICGGTRWRSWLRHCATNRKVAGLIPDGVTGIFRWLNRSGRSMALGSTQPLTEMSTRNPSWG